MIRFTTLFLFASATIASHAGDEKSAGMISTASEHSRWRVGAAYAPIFGLDAGFKGLGTFGSAFQVQPIAPGTSYEYDDGFVRVDSSRNVNGETWNWGYQDAGQVNGNNVTMSLTSANADARTREADEIAQGIDLFAYYEMGKAVFGGKDTSWGFRGGLHYGRVDIGNSGTLTTGTTSIRDTFTVVGSGVVVPGAPYSGSFGGPGPLVGDTPIRDIVAGTAEVSGSRDLDVRITTLNLGGYLEVPVARDFFFSLEGGLSAALANGDYDFRSTTTITGLGTVQSSGSASDTKILPGLYLGLSGIYQINERWAAQLSGRYQYMDGFTLEDGGSEASLNFDSAFVLSVGLVHTF